MAITILTKEDTTFLWGEQATFGTAVTADFNGTTPEWGEILDCEIVALDDYGFNVREPNRSQTNSRVMQAVNYNHDTKGVAPKVTITGDAKKKTMASFLYAVIQNVSEAAVSPSEKTYTFSSTQPDFTNNGGWFGTFYAQQGSSQSLRVTDVISNELVLTCNPNDGQGRMQMQASCLGRSMSKAAASASGTLARYSQDFYYFHDLKTCTVDGSAIVPLGLTITIRNNAIPIGTNNSGLFLSYALPKYEVEVGIKAVWDTNSHLEQTYLDSQGGTVRPVVLTWGTDNNDGYLTFTTYAMVASAVDTYDPVKAIDLTYKAAYDGSNAALTCVLADGIDRAW